MILIRDFWYRPVAQYTVADLHNLGLTLDEIEAGIAGDVVLGGIRMEVVDYDALYRFLMDMCNNRFVFPAVNKFKKLLRERLAAAA